MATDTISPGEDEAVTTDRGRLRPIVRAAIAFHFLMILVVVTHANEMMQGSPWSRPLLGVIDYYSLVTFANRNFGFFAPEVTPDWNIEVLTRTQSGQERRFDFPLRGREMEVKNYSMLGHFAEDNDTMDLFARSWAVYALNHDPDGVAVKINVTRNQIPSMDEYRRGERIRPTPFYRTTFQFR